MRCVPALSESLRPVFQGFLFAFAFNYQGQGYVIKHGIVGKEQILLLQDGGIEFYLVDRVDNGMKSMLQIGLPPEMAQQILHPWAVVAMEDKTREM